MKMMNFNQKKKKKKKKKIKKIFISLYKNDLN